MSARTLYVIAGSPPARAVHLTCCKLGLHVNVYNMNFPEKENFADWFLKLNARHCVPTLVDEDGFVMVESRATMRYLVEKYAEDDSLYPRDLKERHLVDSQLDYDLGHVFKFVAQFLNPIKFMLKTKDERDEKAMKVILDEIDALPTLGLGQYVAGDHLTIADISMLCTLVYLECIQYDISAWSNITSWIARCKRHLPAYDDVYADTNKWIEFTKTDAFRQRMLKRMKDMGLS